MAEGASDFTPLANLAITQKTTIIRGVLLSQLPIRPTKGPDFVWSIVLGDPSYTTDEKEGVIVNVFKPKRTELPSQSHVGDVVFCKIFVVTHAAKLMGTCKEWLQVYSGRLGAPPTPSFEFGLASRELSPKEVYDLRDWSHDKCLAGLTIGELDPPRTRYCDLVGKVVAVDPAEDRLFVWDGTDLKPPFSTPTHPLAEVERASLGSVLAVRHSPHFAGAFNAGDWVQFSSANLTMINGKIKVECAHIKLLHGAHPKVMHALSEYEKRVSGKLCALLHYSTVTKVFGEGGLLPFTTIQTVRSHPQDNYKFRIKGRVLLVWPPTVEEMVRPFCHSCASLVPGRAMECAKCGKDSIEMEIAVTVVVGDATGTLSLLLLNQHARAFFSLKHVDVSSPPAKETLHEGTQRLVAPETLVDVCIWSYHVRGGGEETGALEFRDSNSEEDSHKPKRSRGNSPGLDAVLDSQDGPRVHNPSANRSYHITLTTLSL